MVRLLVIGGLLLALVAGCGNPQDWEPQGRVQFVQWREIDGEGSRSAWATYRVDNLGRVPLSVLDLALSLKTDRDLYYLQVQAKVDLLPGKSAFGTVEISYRSPEERGTLADLVPVSVGFR